jgi:hypothetical protein
LHRGEGREVVGRRDTQTSDWILERTTEKSDTPAAFTVNNRCRLDRLASPDITQLSHRLDGKELRCKAHTETQECTKTVVPISFFCSPKQLLVESRHEDKDNARSRYPLAAAAGAATHKARLPQQRKDQSPKSNPKP